MHRIFFQIGIVLLSIQRYAQSAKRIAYHPLTLSLSHQGRGEVFEDFNEIPLPLERLCRNQQETTSVTTRDRRSGDEALGRKPFIAHRWGAKPMKRNPFPTRPITHNFKRPHSKAEEPDCLFRWNPLSIMITTQSLEGEGGGVINKQY